jgi:hypothetical protein
LAVYLHHPVIALMYTTYETLIGFRRRAPVGGDQLGFHLGIDSHFDRTARHHPQARWLRPGRPGRRSRVMPCFRQNARTLIDTDKCTAKHSSGELVSFDSIQS